MKKSANKTMNILCATDRNFLYPAYVTIQSVIENHKDIDISFFLLAAEDILEDERFRLKEFVEASGNTIQYLSVDDSGYENFIVSERFNKVAYFRLMAHEYLPKSIDRILYLDVDIIVDKNIYDDFYMQDFNGKYLIATSHNPNPDYLNMLNYSIVNLEAAARGEYFNSGVLLMNLVQFRENITIEKYKEAYNACLDQGLEVFYDQGLLNYMFFDKTLYFSSMDYNFRYSIPIDYKNRLDPRRVYKKAIIHYTGMKQPYKPWDLMLEEEDIAKFGDVPFKDNYFYVSRELNVLMKKWWGYAEQTPVYSQVLNEMLLKRKWFRRNLLDFAIKHNKLLKEISLKNNGNKQQIIKEQKIEKLPDNFHYRAYNIMCRLCAPIFAIRRLLKRQ